MTDAATDTALRVAGTVRVVGTGLLGASVGLGLAAKGADVVLADRSPSTVRLAADYGAGRPAGSGDAPALVVVAVPPDVTAEVVAAELAAHPEAVVTDVASVKGAPLAALAASGIDLERYVGSHPLAGRERGGPIAARADLFLGRPWVVCARPGVAAGATALIESLALDLGAIPTTMGTEEHDRSVGLVSHTAHLVSVLMASRLADAPEAALGLAGQGVRDVTRVAASDPALWVQILSANADAVLPLLAGIREDLEGLVAALADADAPGARRSIAERLAAGNAGVARLPGKHGSDRRYAHVVVLVDDAPGELARLFGELGELGINVEDLRLEHSPGAAVGLADVAVVPEDERRMVEDLARRGWRIAG